MPDCPDATVSCDCGLVVQVGKKWNWKTFSCELMEDQKRSKCQAVCSALAAKSRKGE